MKNKTISLGALAALALAASESGAATVTYSTYIATSSTDTSWIPVPGSTEIAAFNVGGGQTTYGGVTWLATNSSGNGYNVPVFNTATDIDFYWSQPNVLWAYTASGFYVGESSVLNDGGWYDSTNAQIDLNGFTVGQKYLVQFVIADTRSFANGATVSLQGVSGVTGNSTSAQYAYQTGEYLVVNAEFTADSASTAWKSITGGTGEQINAIRIVAIPEPSAALLGGLGMLALLRRRR